MNPINRLWSSGIKRYFFTCTILFSVPFFSSATTYYFAANGNDSNNGLSPSSPKKTIDEANSLMLSGNTILFRRGDTWYMPMDSLELGGKTNITLGAYGTGARPVLAGTALLTSWTYTGSNNIWKCVLSPYAWTHRVFVSGISKISLEYREGKNNVLSDLTSGSEYFLENKGTSSAALYIKTLSSTTPPAFVTIVPGKVSDFSTEMAIISRSSNITIRGIEFRGGGSGHVMMVLAPAENITFDSCTIGRASLNGLVVTAPGGSSSVVKNIKVTNCIIDKGWTTVENEIKSTVPISTVLNGDGLALWNGVDSGLIKGNLVTNWGHTGITMMTQEITTSANFGVQKVIVEQNESYAGNSAYMHAFGMIGHEGKVKNNIIKRNYFHDYSSGCTIGGNRNFVFSNIFANVTASTEPQSSKSPWGVNMETWEVPAGSGRSFVCKDNYISNNTFSNTATYAFFFSQNYKVGADTNYISFNKIYNNIMFDFGTDTVSNLETPKRSVAMFIVSNVAQGKTYIRNNNFWASYDTTATKLVAVYENHFYTASALNGCAPCNPANSTNNVQLNPRFTGFFELSPLSSSTLRSGGNNYKAMIIAQGLPAAEFVDYNGVLWPDNNPSIGAVQYVTP
ncbi:MAG: hypothetical protein JNK79_08120 [Chitinophagaceae bacterium]|nr:hypothetical protein [Chitinophagaceae bacterium]